MNDTRPTHTFPIVAAIFIVGSIVVMFVLGVGFAIVRNLTAQPQFAATPTPNLPDLQIADAIVHAGGQFTLVGHDWPADQIVFVYVADPLQPGLEEPIFSGPVDGQGRFALIATYPLYPPWSTLQSVDVIVQDRDQRVKLAQRVAVSSAMPTPGATATPPAGPTGTSTPALTPTPTPTPTPPVFNDWKGEYFGNPGLTGAPAVTRNDVRVNFNWGNGAPDAGLPVDGFSARWTRALDLPGGTYRFTASADDGVRAYIDNVVVIDEWRVGAARAVTRDVPLGAGRHTLRVEMFEQTGLASIDFSFEQLLTFEDWKGEYFANRDLSGVPAMTRNDKVVHFDWGNASPAENIPADGFSARWTRSLTFPAGVTRFVVRADDGVRLLIDGVRVIDEWHDASSSTYSRDVNLAAGAHSLVLEFYENLGSAGMAFVFQPTVFAGWRGEYFANADLAGLPVLVRDDAQLDFNWGEGSPAAIIPPDNFSARWTRSPAFEAGAYRFSLIVDDGGRLFLDGARMIDEWRDSATTTYSFTVSLSAGPHEIRVEYFERRGQTRAAVNWARLQDTPTVTVTSSPSPSPTPTLSPTPSPTLTPTATLTLTPAPAP